MKKLLKERFQELAGIKPLYVNEQGLNRMNRDMTPEEEYLKDNPSPGTSSPMVSGDGNTLKIKPEGGDIQSEVTIKQQACAGNLEKCLEDVTISWGNEGPFKLTFEYDDTVIDAQAYDEVDVAEYVAKSDDEYYQFILDVNIVSPKFSGDGGAIEDFNWETLRIEVDPRMDPEIRSDFDDPIMDEQNTLAAAGSGTSFTSGKGMGYMSPISLKKKRKND